MIITLFNINLATAFFLTFTILSIIALAIGYFYFPETHSKKLKYIDYFWRGGGSIKNFNNQEFNDIAEKVEREVKDYKEYITDYYQKRIKKGYSQNENTPKDN